LRDNRTLFVYRQKYESFPLLSISVHQTHVDQADIIAGLEKGLAVLCLFSSERTRLTIAEAAKEAGLSRAAARRVLLTLTHGGYLVSDGKHFTPTARVMRLSRGYNPSHSSAAHVQSILDQVSQITGESSSAAILDGVEIVYIARSATRRILSVGLGVGSRLPVYATSMGRVLLAFASEEEQKQIFKRAPFKPLTPKTLILAESLRRELTKIWHNGFALVDEELELGLRSIAVPIRGENGRVEIAVNISISAAQMTPQDMVAQLLPVLLKAV
jgi:IclR family transcriptional regulator, pca regulon regulatory protein